MLEIVTLWNQVYLFKQIAGLVGSSYRMKTMESSKNYFTILSLVYKRKMCCYKKNVFTSDSRMDPSKQNCHSWFDYDAFEKIDELGIV